MSRTWLLIALCFSAACGLNDRFRGVAPIDLSGVAASDIGSVVNDVGLGTSDLGTGVDGSACVLPTNGMKAKYVVDTIKIPAQRSDYAYDLTGSGRAQNQFGNIFGAMAQQNLNPQQGVNDSLAAGQIVLLMSESSTDATYQNDSCAQATLQDGLPTTTPPTRGMQYSVDPSRPGGSFAGVITSGLFSSAPSATTKMPVSLALQLPLVVGTAPIPLLIIGAHVQLTYVGGQISGGQLNGAVRQSDVNSSIIPKFTDALENKLAADKGMLTSSDMSILSVFDTGGTTGPMAGGCVSSCPITCQNPASADTRPCTCAVSGDGIVDRCEVATNSIIKSVFTPDVQMFDTGGNYAPNPNPTTKDALSFGVGFTAIPASF